MREKISLSAKKSKQSHHKHTERRIKQEPRPRNKKNGQGRSTSSNRLLLCQCPTKKKPKTRKKTKKKFTQTKSERTTQRKRKQSPPFCQCPTKKETQIKRKPIFFTETKSERMTQRKKGNIIQERDLWRAMASSTETMATSEPGRRKKKPRTTGENSSNSSFPSQGEAQRPPRNHHDPTKDSAFSPASSNKETKANQTNSDTYKQHPGTHPSIRTDKDAILLLRSRGDPDAEQRLDWQAGGEEDRGRGINLASPPSLSFLSVAEKKRTGREDLLEEQEKVCQLVVFLFSACLLLLYCSFAVTLYQYLLSWFLVWWWIGEAFNHRLRIFPLLASFLPV
jgi:hypothetical protein